MMALSPRVGRRISKRCIGKPCSLLLAIASGIASQHFVLRGDAPRAAVFTIAVALHANPAAAYRALNLFSTLAGAPISRTASEQYFARTIDSMAEAFRRWAEGNTFRK
jgi:hypothetical protein